VPCYTPYHIVPSIDRAKNGLCTLHHGIAILATCFNIIKACCCRLCECARGTMCQTVYANQLRHPSTCCSIFMALLYAPNNYTNYKITVDSKTVGLDKQGGSADSAIFHLLRSLHSNKSLFTKSNISNLHPASKRIVALHHEHDKRQQAALLA
jgi:hypothetical protein